MRPDTPSRTPVPGASLTAELAALLVATGGQLVDVRSPAEFSRHGVAGAINVPVMALGWKYRFLNRRRPVILCGENGMHCRRAAQLLAGEGFRDIYHLATGRCASAHAA